MIGAGVFAIAGALVVVVTWVVVEMLVLVVTAGVAVITFSTTLVTSTRTGVAVAEPPQAVRTSVARISSAVMHNVRFILVLLFCVLELLCAPRGEYIFQYTLHGRHKEFKENFPIELFSPLVNVLHSFPSYPCFMDIRV